MKKIILTVFVALFLCGISFAQVNEAAKPMSQGVNNGYSIELMKTEQDNIQKAWKEFIKDYKGKTKADKKSGEIFSDNASIENMSNNTVDVYATVNKIDGGTLLTVWFDLGGAYLSTEQHPEKSVYGKMLIEKFAAANSTSMAEEKLAAEEKLLKEAVKTQEKLEKDKKDYLKKIEDLKEQIKALEAKITENDESQTAQKEMITKQQAKVEKAKTAYEKVKQ